jgi:hypothetical protein
VGVAVALSAAVPALPVEKGGGRCVCDRHQRRCGHPVGRLRGLRHLKVCLLLLSGLLWRGLLRSVLLRSGRLHLLGGPLLLSLPLPVPWADQLG